MQVCPPPPPRDHVGAGPTRTNHRCPHVSGTVATYGHLPADRTARDSGTGMHFVSEYSVDKSGDVVGWEFEAFQSADLFLEIWRPAGSSAYDLVGSSGNLSAVPGRNTVLQDTPFAVQPGDVIGWYSPQVQPIVYTANAGSQQVRRQYQGLGTTLDLSGHAAGWTREYSVAVAIELHGIPHPNTLTPPPPSRRLTTTECDPLPSQAWEERWAEAAFVGKGTGVPL